MSPLHYFFLIMKYLLVSEKYSVHTCQNKHMAHYMGLSNISWASDIEFKRQFQISDQIQWRRISYFSFLCVTTAVITIKQIVVTSGLFVSRRHQWIFTFQYLSFPPLLTRSVEPRVFWVSHDCLECFSYIKDQLGKKETSVTEAPFKKSDIIWKVLKKIWQYPKSGDRKQELLFYNVMCEPLHVPLSGQVGQNWLNCQNCPNGDINKAPPLPVAAICLTLSGSQGPYLVLIT